MNVHGTYVVLPLPPLPGIAAHLTGCPVIHWAPPPHGGIGPVIPPDLDLHMYLDSDFQSGPRRTATALRTESGSR